MYLMCSSLFCARSLEIKPLFRVVNPRVTVSWEKNSASPLMYKFACKEQSRLWSQINKQRDLS